MPEPISVLGSVSFNWLKRHGAAPYDEPYFMEPRVRLERDRLANAIVARAFPGEPIYNFEASLVQVEGRRRPVALVGGLQPNLILGAAVGARFVFFDDQDPDITPTPLQDIDHIDKLRSIDWRHTWPVSQFLDQIAELRATLGGDYDIVPPFFWDTTGRATFHGIVTTALKLFGERSFIDLVVDPVFASELFEWIVDAYGELSELFAEAAGLTITSAHIGDCSACMVGPEHYEQFMLPPLQRLAHRMGALRLHSCGTSDHLLGLFRQLEGLECLNVGSDTSVRAIRELFGPIRIDLIPPVNLLTYESPEAVDRWVRGIVEENDGGRLEFHYHLDAVQPEANCLQIARTLLDLGWECMRETVY